MKEIRKIKKYAIRNMCVENNYYTHATIEEYDAMFAMIMQSRGGAFKSGSVPIVNSTYLTLVF